VYSHVWLFVGVSSTSLMCPTLIKGKFGNSIETMAMVNTHGIFASFLPIVFLSSFHPSFVPVSRLLIDICFIPTYTWCVCMYIRIMCVMAWHICINIIAFSL
jgi:hypothetical protein